MTPILSSGPAPALALPNADLDRLKRRVSNFAEKRPAVYRMIDPSGRVIYVGKAKQLRNRLLSYFRAPFPEDKAARILHAAADIQWKYVPSDFAAYLQELRDIKQHRPVFNVKMNRTKRAVLIKVSEGTAPKVYVGTQPGPGGIKHYGPLTSANRARDAVRILNDLMGIRDCAQTMPMVFADQCDLFRKPVRAACMRHELGTCSGPCAGLVSEADYAERVSQLVDFMDGKTLKPISRVIDAMLQASQEEDYESATRWRNRFDALEWLLRNITSSRNAIESLSFVYHDPGAYGDDRAYVIRRATVRAVAPAPTTPLEREAFKSAIREALKPEPLDGPLPAEQIDEMLLLLNWFRRNPTAMRRTTPLDIWTN